MSEESWQYIDMYQDWSSLGLLPHPGDIGDQPAWVFQVLQIVDREVKKAEIQAMKTKG